MNRKARGILLSYLNIFCSLGCGLFLSTYLLRVLGAKQYGLYQTITSFANYLILLEFGTGTVMTRNISMCRGRNASQEEIDRHVATIWSITNALTVVVVVAAAILYCNLSRIYHASLTADQIIEGKRIFLATVGYLIISYYCQTLNGVALAYERYSFSAVQRITRLLLRTGILTFLIALTHRALWIAVTDLIISGLIMLISLLYCSRQFRLCFRFGYLDRTILRDALPLCVAIFFQAIVNQANNNVDKFIIGIVLNPESVALYSIALFVFSIFSSLTTIPINIFAPQVGKDMSRGISKDVLMERLVAPCRLSAVVGGLIVFGFFAVGKQFIQLLYGADYLLAYPIALLLMAPMYLNMINGVMVNVLNVLNKRLVRSLTLLVTTVGNIVLTIFWIRRWGMLGAAAATAVCTIIGQVLLMNLYYALKLRIPVLRLFYRALKGILVWLVAAAVISKLLSQITMAPLWSFLFCGIVFVVVFIAGFLLFGATNAERDLIKRRKHYG